MQRAKGLLLTVGGALAALLSLAALGGKLLEARLSSELQQRLSARGVAASWRATSWSLREACARELSWTHPESASYGRVDEVCVLGSPALAWPPFEVSEVRLSAPHLITSIEALSKMRSSRAPLPSPLQLSLSAYPSPPHPLKKALRRGLTLSITRGALWLNAKGSPQLSASLTLSVTLGGARGAVEGQGQSSVRLKGIEEPLALNVGLQGPLTGPQLNITPLKGAWVLLSGGGRVSLERVSVDLTQQTARAHQLTLALPPLMSAQLDVSAHLPSRQISASKGHITLSAGLSKGGALHDVSARLTELLSPLTPLKSLTRSLREALSAPHLTSLKTPQAPSLAPTPKITLLGSDLELHLDTSSQGGAEPIALRLEQLSASEAQGQFLLTSPKRPQLNVWGCWGARCDREAPQPSQAHTSWALKARGLDLSSLSSMMEDLEAVQGVKAQLSSHLSNHLSGQLSVAAEGARQEGGALSLRGLALELTAGRLSLSEAEPVMSLPPLSISLSQTLTTPLNLSSLSSINFQGRVGSHSAPLKFTGELSWAEGAERLKVEAEELPCQQAFELLPREALGQLEGARLSGRFAPSLSLTRSAGRLELSLKRLLRRCTFEALTLSPPSAERAERVRVRGRPLRERDVSWLNEPFTFQIDPELTEGERVVVGPASGAYVPLKELPLYVGGAMYLTEEMGFWTGGAFSPQLVENALNTNLKQGRFVYGGSTVTQQLVKNLFLSREKVLTRKLQEVLISARLLDAVSKERLLELYLNCIEFAPAVFGVQAAARYYFQKDARALSPQEAVFLAMLKVSPKRGARWRRAGRSPSFTWWRQRSVEVFERLVSKGLLSERQAQGQAPFVLRWDKSGAYLGAELIDP